MQCIDQNDNRQKHTQIAQMGHIYAAAQLTIVAAAGSDPEYGLPGVASGSRQPLLRARFGRMSLTLLPPWRGVYDILDSRWASRGWTFQETIFSRRRLVFTERQMIFLCNTSYAYEAETAESIRYDDKWAIGRLRPNNSPNKTALEEAVAYLEGFSARDLSYDTDALDAILGALHTISDIHQIWGVPLVFPDEIQKPEVISDDESYSIALMWHHFKPARRRHGFPSWYSIGWAGGIRDYGPVDSSNLLGISVTHATAGKRRLQSFRTIAADFLDYKVIDQRLEVVVLAADALFVRSSDIKEPKIMLPWVRDLYIGFGPLWDVDPSTFAHETWMKCISLESSPDAIGFKGEFLLVVSKGDYYERVALVASWWPPEVFAKRGRIFEPVDDQKEMNAEERLISETRKWQPAFNKVETIRLG